jgi:hypothetical protein
MPPPDAVQHNVLIVGDNLMGDTQAALPSVLTEATIFDEHRNLSGLVTSIDGKTPAAFVSAMLDAHPSTDTVLAEWTGACVNPCPYPYGSQQFFDAWNQSRQAIVDAVRARANPPTIVWVISPPAPTDAASAMFHFTEGVSNALSWQTRAWAPSANVPLADWWSPLMARDDFLGHYDQFLSYQVWPQPQAAPHKVRADDLVNLTVDGAFRTSVWTATALRHEWQQHPITTTTTTTTTTAPAPTAEPAPGGDAADPVVVSTLDGPKAIDFPDPFVFRATGDTTWYAYATGAGFVDLQLITSTDLVNWASTGVDPLPGGSNAWANLFGHSWAPSVIERPSNPSAQRFVMYYTAQNKANGLQCIGRATSSSPAGPFADEQTSPLICQTQGSIDPSPYVAADGSLWLVFSNVAFTGTTSIWSVPLTSDGLSVAGGATRLLSTADAWEGPLIEAPTMITSPSGIELFYSANPFDTSSYSVGVASCDSPTGPCTRIYSTAVLATRDTMAGPGGQTPFQDASGNWQVAFHAWTSPKIGYPAGTRTLRFLPMTFPGGLPKIG